MAEIVPSGDAWDTRLLTLARAVLVVFVAFAAAFALAIGGALLASTLGVERESMAARVLLTTLQFVGFIGGVIGYLWLSENLDLVRAHVPSLRDIGWIAGGIVTIMLAAAAVGQLLSALGVEVAQNQVITVGQQNPTFFLYMIPVSILLVGPAEELVFRGAVQGFLRRAWNPSVAIVVASALFGVAHWVALTGGGSRLSYIVVAGTLGLILGVVYERTQNLVVPAAVHGVYNSVLFAIQYGVATGLVP